MKKKEAKTWIISAAVGVLVVALAVWPRGSKATSRRTTFEPVYFEFNSAQLDDEQTRRLVAVDGPVIAQTGRRVLIIGHTDSTGTETFNLALSEMRAAHVANCLIDGGVAGSMIAIEGRGESDPAVDEVDEYAAAQNRRVTIELA
jgi:outer membrane protein OmpA-like peptidoglycan-associated protein